MPRKALGLGPGLTPQCVHLQPRIVGQRGQSRTGGEPDRLGARVLLERLEPLERSLFGGRGEADVVGKDDLAAERREE